MRGLVVRARDRVYTLYSYSNEGGDFYLCRDGTIKEMSFYSDEGRANILAFPTKAMAKAYLAKQHKVIHLGGE